MKKIIIAITVISFSLGALWLPLTAFAAQQVSQEEDERLLLEKMDAERAKEEKLHEDQPVNPSNILPSEQDLIESSRTNTGVSLPSGSFKHELVPSIIKILLGIAGTLAFIAFTVSGVMLVTAHGNEEIVTKVKNIFLYSVIGLIVIAAAYGVIYGIMTLSFE